MDPYPELETDRLILRPTAEDDCEFIYRLLNSEKWKRYIGDRSIYSISEAKSYITSRMHPQLKALGYANNTLIRKDDQVKIGTCGLYKREGIEGIDIGYALLPEYEGKGYAREAVKEVLRFGFDVINQSEINAYILPNNDASIKLVKHFNFQFEGLRQLTNDDENLNFYTLQKDEWHKSCLSSGI